MMKALFFPSLAAVGVTALALLLMTVAVRSPYTHANLIPNFEPSYTRTEQTVVGAGVPYSGPGMAKAIPVGGDLAGDGRELFVTKGCASCHGLDGRGGIVGPSIAGTDAKELAVKTRVGPKGMPEFATSALSTSDLDAIAAYLKAMEKKN